VEMVAWSDRTGHKLVEWRKEGDIFHFIVRKTGKEKEREEDGRGRRKS